MCSLPGYLAPCFTITLFCMFLGGTHETKNLPLGLGLNITLESFIPFSHENEPLVIRPSRLAFTRDIRSTQSHQIFDIIVCFKN